MERACLVQRSFTAERTCLASKKPIAYCSSPKSSVRLSASVSEGQLRGVSPFKCFKIEDDAHPSLPPLHTKPGVQWPLKGGPVPDGATLNARWLPQEIQDSPVAGGSHVGVLSRRGQVSEAVFQSKSVYLEQPFTPASSLQALIARLRHVDIGKTVSTLLPWSVLATTVAALSQPQTFSWFSKQYYAPALGGIMLSIGLQLSPEDFLSALRRPTPAFLGLALQYAIKPVLAALVCSLFRLPPAFSAGFLLVACVSGAQLSSYASFLADADVALSIVSTSLSTFASVAVTPLLSALLLGASVPVDTLAMGLSILQVVVLPVSLGLLLNTYAKALVDRVRPLLPLLAMVCTSLCIGSPLALSRHLLLSRSGLLLVAPVLGFHLLAFAAGYWLARLMRCEERMCRALSLCGGMQSSTLAMLLASQFLGGANTVPPAISVVAMSLTGLSLGAFWGSGRRLRDLLPEPCSAEALPAA